MLTKSRVLALTGGFGYHKQGVYANFLTCDIEHVGPQIYIGVAAGPYSRRSRGMRDRIRTHVFDAKRKRNPSGLHHRRLKMQEWHANWAALVSFPSQVERELVVLSHTVMIILFGSSVHNHHSACRPKLLAAAPEKWGLNESTPLTVDGLSSYNKLKGVVDAEEISRTHKRLHSNSLAAASTRKRRRFDRLNEGGDIHVNVLRMGARVKRFFITPMIAADGAHLNITIPLGLGLSCGLETTRTVHMRLDLSTNNHHTPYALKSERNSRARRLGILITGSIASGPRQGAKFTHWVQSSRKEGSAHSEKLIEFLQNGNGTTHRLDVRAKNRPTTVIWSKDRFINSTQPPVDSTAQGFRKTPTPQSASLPERCPRITNDFPVMIYRLVQRLQAKVLDRKMRVSPTIFSYFKNHPAGSTAIALVENVRAPVVNIMLSEKQFTAPL